MAAPQIPSSTVPGGLQTGYGHPVSDQRFELSTAARRGDGAFDINIS
jgi:hypothetical protein